MWEKHQIVLLPTSYGSITQHKEKLSLAKGNHYGGGNTTIHQLYILSTEEIKISDYCEYDGYICQFRGNKSLLVVGSSTFEHFPFADMSRARKIIATTNPELIQSSVRINAHTMRGPVRIQQSFIEAYINAHNEGKSLTKVNVQYENTKPYSTSGKEFGADAFGKKYSQLKLNPDNTINISLIEEERTFSDQDLRQAFIAGYVRSLHDQGHAAGEKDIPDAPVFTEWLSKTYPHHETRNSQLSYQKL